jgi:hypothetical protein
MRCARVRVGRGVTVDDASGQPHRLSRTVSGARTLTALSGVCSILTTAQRDFASITDATVRCYRVPHLRNHAQSSQIEFQLGKFATSGVRTLNDIGELMSQVGCDVDAGVDVLIVCSTGRVDKKEADFEDTFVHQGTETELNPVFEHNWEQLHCACGFHTSDDCVPLLAAQSVR